MTFVVSYYLSGKKPSRRAKKVTGCTASHHTVTESLLSEDPS